MAIIQFNDIPTALRTPGVYTEIDGSRALKGLLAVPHTALVIGYKIAAGTANMQEVQSITGNTQADGFFGPGSQLARMCNMFKKNNPNTELKAIAISEAGAGATASATVTWSAAVSASGTGTFNLLLNGTKVDVAVTSGWSATDINSATKDAINTTTYSNLPMVASLVTSILHLSAVNAGAVGNYLDARINYYTNQFTPGGFADPTITAFTGGATDGTLADVWTVIDGTQYNYIVQPFTDATNLTSIETELESRYGPLENLPGMGFTAARGTQASMTTLGNSRNSEFNSIMGVYDSPQAPEEWAAAYGAIAAFDLNQDPARPLQTEQMIGILPPPDVNKFTQAERNILLYDGISTTIYGSGGETLIERVITTYQNNNLGVPDPTFLDANTLATLYYIRFQVNARLSSRFIVTRQKLADDGTPVTPGSNIVTPSVIRAELIALFTDLLQAGVIENLADFVDNLIVERASDDVNRVNVLLPPDLINQLRVIAGTLRFVL